MAVAGLAWGGTILGHLSAYVLAFPGHGARGSHLAATGHGSFRTVMLTAAAAVAVAVGITVLRALRPGPIFAVPRLAVTLAAIQVPAFILLEMAERGFDPAAAATDPAVLIGLVMQLVVAMLLSLAVMGLAHSVRAMVASVGLHGRSPSTPRPPRPALLVDVLGLLRARPLRGPPHSSGS
jgi:hypothetical protein